MENESLGLRHDTNLVKKNWVRKELRSSDLIVDPDLHWEASRLIGGKKLLKDTHYSFSIYKGLFSLYYNLVIQEIIVEA